MSEVVKLEAGHRYKAVIPDHEHVISDNELASFAEQVKLIEVLPKSDQVVAVDCVSSEIQEMPAHLALDEGWLLRNLRSTKEG
ncbi:hypothetical protein SAMN02745129_2611 [Ferrimonas marina]|uniref:Uncharacterized protein n=1 Tax=Ferrimonas marina TaxID=299255 RepID=A0A1M5UKQ3_9GAMM|nr:hypothetical protein SAMN02745129_2611 [Ferrimonas marina]